MMMILQVKMRREKSKGGEKITLLNTMRESNE